MKIILSIVFNEKKTVFYSFEIHKTNHWVDFISDEEMYLYAAITIGTHFFPIESIGKSYYTWIPRE